jgi:hypothetical protein
MANASANLQLALFSSGFVNPVLPHQIQKFAILMLMGINNKIPAGCLLFDLNHSMGCVPHPASCQSEG